MKVFDDQLFDGTLIEVNKDMDVFSNSDYFNDDIYIEKNKHAINIKNKNIKLHGFFPNVDQSYYQGSCLIQISRHVKKAENDLTFNHKEILDLFYFGKETNIKYKMRKFVKDYLENYDQYIVDLGNSRVYLYKNEVDDLCQVIDIFIKEYISRINGFMDLIGNSSFEPYEGNIKKIKLTQIELSLWKKITYYVQSHQSKNGSYDDGYIFTTLGNINHIGLDNQFGEQLFHIVGYPVQSQYNSEIIEVDIVWEYIEDQAYYRKSKNQYTIEKTYLFLINNLMSQFLFTHSTDFSNKGVKFRKKRDIIPMTSEEIMKRYKKTNYKLNLLSIEYIYEISQSFYKLAEYLKSKKYYQIDIEPLQLLAQYIYNSIESSFTIEDKPTYQYKWVYEIKEDINSILKSINIEASKGNTIKGFEYSKIFNYFEKIIIEFESVFITNDPFFKDIVQRFSGLIFDYNEHQLVKLLIK